MNKEFKREKDVAENMRSSSALQQLSEPQLVELQHHILSLKTDLQRIPLLNDELVEEVVSPQSYLNRWLDLVERISTAKQKTATCDELSTWDNEGGRVQPAL
jgi:hypothetical protein